MAQSIIVGDTTSSSVNYHNIKDTLLSFGNSWDPLPVFYVDVDNDSINDIKFNFSHSASPGYSSDLKTVFSLTNIEFFYAGNNIYLDTIAKESLINNSLNWRNIVTGNKLRYTISTYIPPPGSYSEGGNFIGSNNYLGFRKITVADTIYGWFLLDMNYTIKIKSWAYESKSDVGISENYKNNKLSIYPNPTTSILTISSSNISQINSKIEIVNTLGQIVLIQWYSKSIDVSVLSKGLYTLKVITQENEIYYSKFIKE